nr:hypothetical protein BaRGS_003459 [Batillaria attramentaria]
MILPTTVVVVVTKTTDDEIDGRSKDDDDVDNLVDDDDVDKNYSFTHQYLQLNALLNELPASEFTVLGVPCNQFGHQEPAANKTELYAGLKHVRPGNGYVPSFALTMKADVNGEDELELYTHLKSKCPSPGHTAFSKSENFWDPIKPTDISWNFEKFLLDVDGVPLYRFSPDVEPKDLKPLINDVWRGGGNVRRHIATIEETVALRVLAKERDKSGIHHA